MAWFFKKNKQNLAEKDDSKIHKFLTTSFSHVKNDIHNLVEWLRYFNQKHDEHDIKFQQTEQKLAQIQQQLSYLPYIHSQMQHIANQHNRHQILLQKVRNLHSKVSLMDHDHTPILKRLEEIEAALLSSNKPSTPIIHRLNDIHSRLEILENQPISKPKTVKDKMYQNLTRNSKQYIKKLILNLISKYENISATQLKQIIVDEQALCSKSTFYRILNEAEKQDFIDVITQGKEKKYLAKQLTQI